MKRLVRTVSVCWGLAPFAIAFMRDRRSFLIWDVPPGVRMSSIEHVPSVFLCASLALAQLSSKSLSC